MMAWVTECVRPCVTAWVRSVVIDRAAANVSGFVESATILWVIAGPATIEIACEALKLAEWLTPELQKKLKK